MRFFSPKNENEVKTWTKFVNRNFVDLSGKEKRFQVSKYTKKLQPEKEQLQEIPSDPEHHPVSPFSSSRLEEPTCSTFADVSLLSSEIGNVDFYISKNQECRGAIINLNNTTT